MSFSVSCSEITERIRDILPRIPRISDVVTESCISRSNNIPIFSFYCNAFFSLQARSAKQMILHTAHFISYVILDQITLKINWRISTASWLWSGILSNANKVKFLLHVLSTLREKGRRIRYSGNCGGLS